MRGGGYITCLGNGYGQRVFSADFSEIWAALAEIIKKWFKLVVSQNSSVGTKVIFGN